MIFLNNIYRLTKSKIDLINLYVTLSTCRKTVTIILFLNIVSKTKTIYTSKKNNHTSVMIIAKDK